MLQVRRYEDDVRWSLYTRTPVAHSRERATKSLKTRKMDTQRKEIDWVAHKLAAERGSSPAKEGGYIQATVSHF